MCARGQKAQPSPNFMAAKTAGSKALIYRSSLTCGLHVLRFAGPPYRLRPAHADSMQCHVRVQPYHLAVRQTRLTISLSSYIMAVLINMAMRITMAVVILCQAIIQIHRSAI